MMARSHPNPINKRPHPRQGQRTTTTTMRHLLLPSSSSPLLLHRPSNPLPFLHPHARVRGTRIPNAASNGSSSSSGDGTAPVASNPPAPSPSPDTAAPAPPSGVRTRLRSRNLQQGPRRQPDYPPAPEEVTAPKDKRAKKDAARKERERERERRQGKGPKAWEEMSMPEKAVELLYGEKGLLFWLNKSAYASIFIMAGAWILFRFVGPSLGLYQLDAPPLAPTDVLRGS